MLPLSMSLLESPCLETGGGAPTKRLRGKSGLGQKKKKGNNCELYSDAMADDLTFSWHFTNALLKVVPHSRSGTSQCHGIMTS